MPPGKRVRWLPSYPSNAPHLLVSTLDGIVVLQDFDKGVGLEDLALGLSREKHVPQQLQQPAHPESRLKPHFPSPECPHACVSYPRRSKSAFLRSDAQHSAQPNKPQKVAHQEANSFPCKVFETPDRTERTTFHARQLSEDEHISI